MLKARESSLYVGWQNFISLKDIFIYLFPTIGWCLLIGLCFFDRLTIAALFMVIGMGIKYQYRYDLFVLKRDKLEQEFKEILYMISSALTVGQSLENALSHSCHEMKEMYGLGNLLVYELDQMVGQMKNGVSVEEALKVMALKLEIEVILQFSDIITTAKRSGGNLVEIVKYSSMMISDKIDLNGEINVIISKKKWEMQIMTLFVPGMIMYLRLTMKGFLEPLYNTISGGITMLVLLGMYLVAMLMGNYIMKIK